MGGRLTYKANKKRSLIAGAGSGFNPHFSPVDSGMFTALRFLGLLDILSSMPAAPFVACLVSTPVCTASRQNTVRNAG